MNTTISEKERASIIRLASTLPAGSPERENLLFLLGEMKAVRGASTGTKRWAFSVQGVIDDIFDFYGKLADGLEEISKLIEKVNLDPESVKKINRACEAANRKIEAALRNKPPRVARRKQSNLLGVALLASNLSRISDTRPQRGGTGIDPDFLLMLLYPLGVVMAVVAVLWEVLDSSADFVLHGKESPMHKRLKEIALKMLKYAESKEGWVKKAIQFLSKFVHSNPT